MLRKTCGDIYAVAYGNKGRAEREERGDGGSSTHTQKVHTFVHVCVHVVCVCVRGACARVHVCTCVCTCVCAPVHTSWHWTMRSKGASPKQQAHSIICPLVSYSASLSETASSLSASIRCALASAARKCSSARSSGSVDSIIPGFNVCAYFVDTAVFIFNWIYRCWELPRFTKILMVHVCLGKGGRNQCVCENAIAGH